MALFGRDDRSTGDGPEAGETGSPGTGGIPVGRGPAPVRGVLSKVSSETGESVANVGTSIKFKGEITGQEDLVIDGNVEGKVSLPSHQLTISSNGKVRSDVEARVVLVVGHLEGDVTASERVEVQPSGVVDGDIRAPKLLVHEGARLNGGVEMTPGARPLSVVPSAS